MNIYLFIHSFILSLRDEKSCKMNGTEVLGKSRKLGYLNDLEFLSLISELL